VRIILGSQSLGRKKILEEMGYDFEVMPSNIDEKAIRNPNPSALTLALAIAKARALLPKIEGEALLITADKVVVLRDTITEKPQARLEAYRFLRRCSSNSACIVTSVLVTNTLSHSSFGITDKATVYFRYIPPKTILEYIATGDCYNHAGGFDHEHPVLAPYIQRIDGERESIIGLPRKLTEALLVDFLSEERQK